jgi:hypothetical protein
MIFSPIQAFSGFDHFCGSHMTVNSIRKAQAVLLQYLSFFLPAAVVFFVFGASSEAQQAAAPAAQQTAAAASPPVPKPQWVGKVSGGIQFESGRTSNGGVTVSGDVAKNVTARQTVSFDGVMTYATYKVAPFPRTTATNNIWFGGQVLHKLNTRFFLVDRVMFNRDLITGVSHRELNALGIGINLFLSPRGQFYVVPAFGLGNQITAVREINGFTTGFVSYEKLVYKLNDMWSVNQYSMVRTSAKNHHDMSIKAYAGLDAPALYKRLYLSIGLDYNYEGVLSPRIPGITRNDAIFGVKFNYRIGN